MTILEAKFLHGTREYVSSAGDNLTSLVRRIYKSDDPIYFFILKVLNQRFDWHNVKPGSVIHYLNSSIVSSISEIW